MGLRRTANRQRERETDNIKNKRRKRVGGFVDEMYPRLAYLLQHLPCDGDSPSTRTPT
jgi:hypothetical protein